MRINRQIEELKYVPSNLSELRDEDVSLFNQIKH